MPLCCKSGYRVGPDGKKIAYRYLPSDAVRLKVLLSKLSFIKTYHFRFLIFLNTTYISGVACENSTRRGNAECFYRCFETYFTMIL